MRHGRWISSWSLLYLLTCHTAICCLAADGGAAEEQASSADGMPAVARYRRVTILGPVTGAAADPRLQPPSDDEIIQAFTSKGPKDPAFAKDRKIRVFRRLVREHTDPDRFIPLIGMCALHHAYYQCTIYSTPKNSSSEKPASLDPIDEHATLTGPEYLVRRLFVDHNHFVMSDRPVPAGLVRPQELQPATVMKP
jgi:hypothetical protein